MTSVMKNGQSNTWVIFCRPVRFRDATTERTKTTAQKIKKKTNKKRVPVIAAITVADGGATCDANEIRVVVLNALVL